MNRLHILIFILFTFLFATAFSKEDLVPVQEINPKPLIIKKVGHNKLIAEVTWDGTLERDDEPVKTKFRCFSDAVTVKHALFGDPVLRAKRPARDQSLLGPWIQDCGPVLQRLEPAWTGPRRTE
ncbi:hypothetical protein GLOIN_2v1478262 [Rhizophagus irregularis DAOM 181602=DAOM 197198]|uniref:Uncharacterized protein n=1 Tax=Rhizophagus irregularis (strain DAOM 181602 / DAOM 197198 / MUCL 43194) TaxID=747089 RepID=A0A2P4Q1Y5_RHIID|nr:hypothetical protein GLOIN_2v1478262 [Rhizophagus irregularis DAOM 181602=DAOM 197198]POG71653.1 hypothetical protein GLOIN_2v1478262 [Rhizophagus irregularis DAOM 181602=DAOM 197198]|eukprot:XP_025178519.1 hypothetical protein GLOIN_2v1478262 [Rhizophagus irregularis DAOM 181602=DAOM 197198]